MSEEEILSLNGYLEDLYQAMQIGDIVYEPKHSSELYNLINKLLEENQKYKEIIDKAINELERGIEFCKNDSQELYNSCNIAICREESILKILKEVEHGED